MLNHLEIVAPGASPTWTACLMHGILGNSANLRTIARRFVATPEGRDCRMILPDLRGHGDSWGSTFGPPAPPPHTVEACAADLASLEESLGHTFSWVLGHSFGGKVACTFAALRPESVKSVWLLDTNPRPASFAERSDDDGVVRVFAAIGTLGDDLPPREAVIENLQALGISPPTAMWLGTSVRRRPDGTHTWRFSRSILAELIADYADLDCWSALIDPNRPDRRQRLVRGGRSDRFDSETLALLDAQDALKVSVLPGAGHWLHADDPDGLLALLQVEAGLLAP